MFYLLLIKQRVSDMRLVVVCVPSSTLASIRAALEKSNRRVNDEELILDAANLNESLAHCRRLHDESKYEPCVVPVFQNSIACQLPVHDGKVPTTIVIDTGCGNLTNLVASVGHGADLFACQYEDVNFIFYDFDYLSVQETDQSPKFAPSESNYDVIELAKKLFLTLIVQGRLTKNSLTGCSLLPTLFNDLQVSISQAVAFPEEKPKMLHDGPDINAASLMMKSLCSSCTRDQEKGCIKYWVRQFATAQVQYAVQKCGFDVFQRLLAIGADLHHRNEISGKIVLDYAPIARKPGLLFALKIVKYGLNVDYKTMEFGSTLQMFAAQQGEVEVVRHLLELGANPNCKNDKTRKLAIDYAPIATKRGLLCGLEMVKYGLNVDYKTLAFGSTLLMFAAQQGEVEVVQQLLQLGADPNCKNDKTRKLAIDYAPIATKRGLLCGLEMVKYGLNVDYKTLAFGSTLLMFAAQQGEVEIVQQLLQLGADPNCTNHRTRKLAIDYALHASAFDTAVILMKTSGFSLDYVDNTFGSTPLMYAAQTGSVDVVLTMLEMGQDPRSVNKTSGKTAFDYGFGNTQLQNCYVLLKAHSPHICIQHCNLLKQAAKSTKHLWLVVELLKIGVLPPSGDPILKYDSDLVTYKSIQRYITDPKLSDVRLLDLPMYFLVMRKRVPIEISLKILGEMDSMKFLARPWVLLTSLNRFFLQKEGASFAQIFIREFCTAKSKLTAVQEWLLDVIYGHFFNH